MVPEPIGYKENLKRYVHKTNSVSLDSSARGALVVGGEIQDGTLEAAGVALGMEGGEEKRF